MKSLEGQLLADGVAEVFDLKRPVKFIDGVAVGVVDAELAPSPFFPYHQVTWMKSQGLLLNTSQNVIKLWEWVVEVEVCAPELA